ncbi:MAG: hypothetical protein COX37_01955 [Candidatus Nealsonbacteria bacterium CG23_combo_of_CG06-09_8_20_14_all_39_17]|uniref:ABC transporter ATP-binding protein n=1 Tax=Candidatus Nealsonbacteria bacterium CG23_combo_of_CG06-09_8_20_14_all_39_17 TaxID=1974722 RepID=A0A2G9YVN6_9BACT|nr:MAG: hypothetical protein COX37_01955 [Candidatus Nealsonbacteria bacterium CG23_combo_of_CG06-09_8_20_14_all_39_17]PIU44001.1 MAG: hypothetical protein COS96_01210 [Candidatus Nealsonbacteria bacterium CG07_land_8_20_14_0_80_39_13]
MEFLREIKIIWKYLRGYKKEVYKFVFLSLASSIFLAIVPYIYGRLVDITQEGLSDLGIIFAVLGLWFSLNIIGVLLNLKSDQGTTFLGIDIYTDLICLASWHVSRLPISFHKAKKMGGIYSKIERAAHYIQTIVDEVLAWFLPQVLTAIIGIAILFTIEWKLALGAIFIVLGYFLIIIYKTPPIIKAQKNLNKVFESASGNLHDSIINTQTIKACTAEEFQKKMTREDYKEKAGNVLKNFNLLWISLDVWEKVFYSIGFIVVFGSGIWFLKIDGISVGEFIMFLGYLDLLHEPLTLLGYEWQIFRTGMTAIKRVEKLLEVKKENYNEKGIVLKDVKGEVEFRNVSFGYKKGKMILDEINLVANPGQKIALIGGSGEGKTTLVDLLSLYIIPNKGKIMIDGTDIRKLKLKNLRDNIAYVPQDIILFNNTIKNNIRLGKFSVSDEKIIEAVKAANADHFIEKFPKKYNQFVGERGIKLSAGQRQRIAIARALIREPKILILDEATSSLDVRTEKLVQEALDVLVKGRTTFIIAHRLSTIRNADKILVLKNGRIAEQGNHQELMEKQGEYYKLYSLQFSG